MLNRLVGLLFAAGLKYVFNKGVDSVGKSALEQDFGEASEDDIVVPEAVFQKRLPLEQMAAPLCELFQAIDGLDVAHVTKIGQRLKELPVGKQSRFRYQVKDDGNTVELQATLTKLESGQVGIELRSSNGIIRTVMACFHSG